MTDGCSDQPTTKMLAAAFNLTDLDPRSLTPWARVFRARDTRGRPVVVKRTASQARNALAMAAWTRAAAAAGLPVVAPSSLAATNPQPVGAGWWVVYPWVPGEVYSGKLEQVQLAGDLLGRQHALAVDASELRPYTWPEVDEAAMDADLERLAARVPDLTVLQSLAVRWRETSLPALRRAGLPSVGVSSDFKANNLVYTSTGPVLVDPDNGGLEPRLLDLALAVLLFHYECPTAPGRLFTLGEWVRFRDAYTTRVELSVVECEQWPAALDHMLWEEGTWALDDSDDDAWSNDRQGGFLHALATTTPDMYPLD